MRSSTSSSKQAGRSGKTGPGLATSWLLLAGVIALLIVVEVVSRVAVPRLSKIERRTSEEYSRAIALGSRSQPSVRVLVAGNSLLNAGVDFPSLSKALGPEVEARRLVIESTEYYDWYYGLRRLIRPGARPDVVVLVLSASHILSDGIRGPYSVHRMMQLRDLLQLAGELRLGRTDTSGLILANLSAFYGLREELRKQTTSLLVPGLPALAGLFAAGSPGGLTPDGAYRIALDRLPRLRALVDQSGARLLIVIPPSRGGNVTDVTAAVKRAGAASGIDILVPIEPNQLGPELYGDGSFHLNDRGAAIFTQRLVEELNGRLASRR